MGGEKKQMSLFTEKKQTQKAKFIHVSSQVPLFSTPFKQANDFETSEKYKNS